jgi:hypothetical protein
MGPPMTVRKIFLPSRIRRGRTSTSPVWLAQHGDRELRFGRKRDAERYEREGCADHRSFCGSGGGTETETRDDRLRAAVRDAVDRVLRNDVDPDLDM